MERVSLGFAGMVWRRITVSIVMLSAFMRVSKAATSSS